MLRDPGNVNHQDSFVSFTHVFPAWEWNYKHAE